MLLAMPSRGFLVVNPRSGDRRPTVDELSAEAERLHVAVHVLSEDEDAADVARAAEASALGIAGGDGSLAAVAAVAIERGLPFVCVPFGTRNHFARDLGLDNDDPVAALEAFGGTERRVDVGRVGGKLFLNNVSLGLYARLVHERERHRFRRQLLASVRALALVVQDRHPVVLSVDGQPTAARILLFANNAYRHELFSLGERDRLDEGRVYLYEAGGLLPGRWRERRSERFVVDSEAKTLRAAIDGDPVELDPPLDLAIEPRALRVLVPPG
jgi:diacylglycerol kinase family enzyme